MNSPSNTPDRILRIGGLLTVLGMVLSLIALSPSFTNTPLPSLWWFLSMITGAGLITVLVGIRRSSKARSRAIAGQKSAQGDS
jgi:UDP-N-acetylmuramyl pentapeptide phosphotransferase/UDP-N-acetylglucosamine-1-phosphate transferase